jgi:hypothetical protein
MDNIQAKAEAFVEKFGKEKALLCCDEIIKEIGDEYPSRIAFYNSVKTYIKDKM